MNINQLVLLAILAESIWETVKPIWEKKKLNADKLGSIAVSIIITVGAGVDLFTIVGIPINVPSLGLVLTGIIISRGANFIHDLMRLTEAIKIKHK
ncbi:MAG: hypothetical protein GX550_00300 [Syntrophomonadaceae bacterium]|nr:hypothetical protein [Syntrophomonadaceae bacterium]